MKAMGALQGLEPAEVMYYFERLSDMPRGSRNEKQVSDYVADFARERGLEYHQDDMHNILVKKPGTPGYEDAPTVILHGHLDMVCKKDDGVEHDFSNEGVELKVDGDFVEAEGTSLGADNGLGISYMLALLDSGDIPHPPLEAVMTVMEEMGKVGGANFDVGLLSGKRMIDFNWIAEEQLLAGCAGDVSCEMRLSPDWETLEQGLAPMELEIKGLKGDTASSTYTWKGPTPSCCSPACWAMSWMRGGQDRRRLRRRPEQHHTRGGPRHYIGQASRYRCRQADSRADRQRRKE